jgi:fructokinase
MNIISIGEVLWDVFDSAEHIGGATFNFSAHAARLGHHVAFVSAVGEDDRGRRALARLNELGLSARFVRRTSEAATGHVTVFVDAAGQPDFTLHRPAAYDFPMLDEADLAALSAMKPDWVYFGTLAQCAPRVREATVKVLRTVARARRFYDINLRKGSYSEPLIRELLADATVLKINDDEVNMLQQMFRESPCSLEDFCRAYSDRYGWEGVCVTRGAAGCAAFVRGEFVEAPGYKVKVADTVGAGDAFGAAFLHGLGQRWSVREIADFANRLGALVASRSGAVPEWRMEELPRMPQEPPPQTKA